MLSRQNFIIYITIICLSCIYCIDYPKNSGIANTPKLPQIRSESVEDLDYLKRKLFENKENAMVVFYADWCAHCKEFIPLFDAASQYALAQNFSFFKVNCLHKAICSEFNVKRYPTMKVFYKGQELDVEPGRDLDSMLEFTDKLTAPSLVELDSQSEIPSFKKLYGESAFLLTYTSKDSEFYKCVESLAENLYKTLFYIGTIPQSKYISDSIKAPSLIFSKTYQIYQTWEQLHSCDQIKMFFEQNKYPLMRKLDSFFIKRLQKDERILILTAVSLKNSVHMNFVDNVFTNLSVKNRDFVFSYIDVEQDAYLVNYFGINLNQLPKIILYNFAEKSFFVDNTADENVYKSEEAISSHVDSLIKAIKDATIMWSTGNFLEDTLAKFGIKFDQKTLMYILSGCFACVILILVVVIFYCSEEKNDEDVKKMDELLANMKECKGEEKVSDVLDHDKLKDMKEKKND